MFNRVAFIGIGLIGSSIARVMRRDNLASTIIACARTDETLDAAKRLLTDETTRTLRRPFGRGSGDDLHTSFDIRRNSGGDGARAETGRNSDRRGVCQRSTVTAVMPHLPKGSILSQVTLSLAPKILDPGWVRNTVWGTLVSDHATATIRSQSTRLQRYGNRQVARSITGTRAPRPGSGDASHLPHLIAYTIVSAATDLEDHIKSEVVNRVGFRDFTRIAASDQ